MSKLIAYHGTSAENADRIMDEGFKVFNIKRNWKIESIPGFVYFSLAYAPFYASVASQGSHNLAIIKCEIDQSGLYPEDDFLMFKAGKPNYAAEDIKALDIKKSKYLWRESLKHMGNVAAKPHKVRILKAVKFNSKYMLMKFDPIISPINYKIFGKYYQELTEWICEGKPIQEFRSLNQFLGITGEAAELINGKIDK